MARKKPPEKSTAVFDAQAQPLALPSGEQGKLPVQASQQPEQPRPGKGPKAAKQRSDRKKTAKASKADKAGKAAKQAKPPKPSKQARQTQKTGTAVPQPGALVLRRADADSLSDALRTAQALQATTGSAWSLNRKQIEAESELIVHLARPDGIAWLDRDGSILDFNERVFDWAERDDVPLLERLRYLCIVSSNLDEFFEVRVADHLEAARDGVEDDEFSVQSYARLSHKAQQLVQRQYALYNKALLPALQEQGIQIFSHGKRNAGQRRWVKEYFDREVRPLLTPVALDPAHPFPQVANKTLNFIVRLDGEDAFGNRNEIAIVKVPRVLSRFVRLPDALAGGKGKIGVISLSSIIRTHLPELFPGRKVVEFSQFRVTRHSDLAVTEGEVQNLRTALRRGLQHRHFGKATRIEVSHGCSAPIVNLLLAEFELPEQALYRVEGPVNLVRLNQVIDLIDGERPALLFPRWIPQWPRSLKNSENLFARIRQKDVLIHQPFESFDAVVEFLRQAVKDPDVLAIKQTVYRTGADSVMMELLREAVRKGKEVTAVVELKARFDEENNINWAEMLEAIGVQVVYGIVGLKTHGKMLLVTRREARGLKRYGHLSTGNYNPRTAKLYTDLSYLTANDAITADMDAVFTLLASQVALPPLNRLLVAPFTLHATLMEHIAQAQAAAQAGQPARIVAKMNALTDWKLAAALHQAAQHGVQIDLIVRAACVLPALHATPAGGAIRIRSIVGRFLEHTRVFFFQAGQQEQLYLASADWMNRNMARRVELAWPVRDAALRQRIVDECLVAYLMDDQDAWVLQEEGQYRRLDGDTVGVSAQQMLAHYFSTASALRPRPRSAGSSSAAQLTARTKSAKKK
ncbi:polyphosphate kinase 1 [Vandammella animalimorsus]|uniref:Polyphosphate kinase n=1 Tax=Vandammella animalimorsus TaxID=2029117 RepID=A0A2A2ATS6_9BURK|nr:polyphosphate kinase 1 [Vandammella animalimorsus]PAT41059.1 polyphosphate kinase 1 [Vandammella animalimorsus]